MDPAAVLALFDDQMRRAHGPGGRVRREDGENGGWCGVVWSALDETTADAAIAEQVRWFTARGREFEWKLYGHDTPVDLPVRLRAAGFAAEPEETLMVAPAEGPAAVAEPPDGIELREVTDESGIGLVADVHEAAFGTSADRLRQQLRAQLADEPEAVGMTVAVSTADGRPVSAARLELHEGTDFASLWGGGTVPEWRGHGIYRALVAHRARRAAAHGYSYLQTDALPTSRPILQRLGFTPLTTTTPYVYAP
ncbi:GNAT family N-acetyltransferase [Streptomyces sp. NPDC054796]